MMPTLVLMVTVDVAVPFAAGVTVPGENEQTASPGSVAQLKFTAEENASSDVMVTVVVAVPCVATVADVGSAVIVKSGPDTPPVPERVAV